MNPRILHPLIAIVTITCSPVAHFGETTDSPEVTSPRLVHQRHFQYPQHLAITRNIHAGYARIHFTVTEQGEAIDMIATEATHPDFARAAMEGLRITAMVPATENGQPIAVRTHGTFQFHHSGTVDVMMSDHIIDHINMRRPAEPVFRLMRPRDLDQPLKLVDDPVHYHPVDEHGQPLAGEIVVEFFIARDGQTRQIRPDPTAHPAIQEAARRTVENLRFEPPTHKGTAVPVRVKQVFIFRDGS